MQYRPLIQRLFFILATGLLLAGCERPAATGRQTQAGPELAAHQIATDYLAASGLPGIAVTVGRGDSILWSEGFGLADVEQQVPMDPARTRLRVGSLAKPFTAMAVGQLVEQGRLDLDAPIQKYLPDYPVKEAPITSRQLGGHLAGIRHYKDGEFFSARAYQSVGEGLAIFKDDPLVSTPGEAFHYSTYGYNLLSAVVEAAAGQDFLAYMSEHVFASAGMAHTTADHVFPIIPFRSRYYELQDGQLSNSAWVDNSNKWAGGGFLSTTEDLVRFAFAHMDKHHLKPETIALLWTPQTNAAGEATGYGIGWGTRTDEQGRRYVGHTGGSVGGTTNLRIYPEQGLVIAVVTNTSGGDIAPLTDQIAETFLK
jgi:serine beta-lactamase-like protein LACTB